jgi:hypothetical protein
LAYYIPPIELLSIFSFETVSGKHDKKVPAASPVGAVPEVPVKLIRRPKVKARNKRAGKLEADLRGKAQPQSPVFSVYPGNFLNAKAGAY